MTQVLMLLDYQEAVCGKNGLLGAKSGLSAHTAERDVIEKASHVLRTARSRGVPVIHVGVAFDTSYRNRTNRGPGFARFEENRWMLEGSPESEFIEDLQPLSDEPVVYKGCVDPFIGTNLLEHLIRLGATELHIGGTATNYVVESTARHAADMGYSVVILEDICASYNDTMHRFAIEKTLPLFAEIRSIQDW